MPTWLHLAAQTQPRDVLAGAVITIVSGLALAGAVGLFRYLFGAQRREGVSDAQVVTFGTTLSRMESKLDALAAGHAESREARVRQDAELSALRESHARHEAEVAALRGEIRRVDESHTTARHTLRTEIQGWVSAGISDALELLRALMAGAGGGDGGTRPRPARRGP